MITAAAWWWTTRPDGDPIYHAEFADASELVARNDVRINDVVVGAVTDVQLDGHVARVSFRVEEGRDVPAGTVATIRQASLLGERYVDLEPAGEGQLSAGDTIPLAQTRRAEDLETIVGAGTELVSSLGSDSINRILHAADRAFVDDQGEALGRLIDSSAEAARTFTDAEDDLAATIERMDEMSAAFEPNTAQVADSLGRFADGLEALAAHDDELRAFTEELTGFSVSLSGVLERNRDRLLTFGDQATQVLQEAVNSLAEVDRGIAALYDFNASWSCISDGPWISQTFVLLPELATINYGPGHCDPELGGRSRDMRTQIVVDPGEQQGPPGPPGLPTEDGLVGPDAGIGPLATSARPQARDGGGS